MFRYVYKILSCFIFSTFFPLKKLKQCGKKAEKMILEVVVKQIKLKLLGEMGSKVLKRGRQQPNEWEVCEESKKKPKEVHKTQK